jgi:PST family polysaccharide transporter
VNEQSEVGLLLAGPGILATLTFAPLIINLLYSSSFDPAIELLRWNCLGMILRVVSWPLGFILFAKGVKLWILLTEILANLVHLALVWTCLEAFGLSGAGVGFTGLYAFHAILVYTLARKLSGFRWSPANRRLAVSYGPCILLAFFGASFLPRGLFTAIGTLATAVAVYSSLKSLSRLIPWERLPRLAQGLMTWLRLHPAAPNA